MIVKALGTGQYPTEVLDAIDKNSRQEGIQFKRLPQLTDKERETIKGS